MPSLSPWKVGKFPGRGKLSSLSSDVDENQRGEADSSPTESFLRPFAEAANKGMS